MKYLNNYKIFESVPNIGRRDRQKLEIDAICYKYGITNYTINEDGSIDVDGNVNLEGGSVDRTYEVMRFDRLPLKFNSVNGNFSCSYNVFTTLNGSPKYVGGNFSCRNNYNMKMTLEGCPKYVGGRFICPHNKITSLESCPEYIGGNFDCYGNPIYVIVKHFIERDNKNNLIELFNYCDIIQDVDPKIYPKRINVIYDRLKYFFEEINIKLTETILTEIENNGYRIVR